MFDQVEEGRCCGARLLIDPHDCSHAACAATGQSVLDCQRKDGRARVRAPHFVQFNQILPRQPVEIVIGHVHPSGAWHDTRTGPA